MDTEAQSSAMLYVGEVMHQRMQPRGHRFAYKVFNVVLDIRNLREINRISSIFSANHFNFLSFYEKDHGPKDGSSLVVHIERLSHDAGITAPLGSIYLWCYPRVLGYVFNPLSVYYVYGIDHTLLALNYEVRNTFGQIHSYFLPIKDGQITEAGIRQSVQKAFFVSPFMDVSQTYNFRMSALGERLNVRILETQADGSPILAATFRGKRAAFTTRVLLKETLKIPFLTLKIIFAIHWEGLKLWAKGIALYDKPKRGGDVSIDRIKA